MRKLTILAVAAVALSIVSTPLRVTKADSDPSTSISLSPVASSSPTKTLHLRVTAYASTPDETDDTPFITAMGTMVHDGIVATNLLPFETKVMIPSLFGDKIFIVEDRMNKRFSQSIDVWMPTKSKAIVFGVRNADIVIVKDDSIAEK